MTWIISWMIWCELFCAFYVTRGMCTETGCPQCKVLLYTYWVYPSTRYNQVRESLHARHSYHGQIRIVWVSLLLSRQLYVINSVTIFEFIWSKHCMLRTEALLMVVGHAPLESQWLGSSNCKIEWELGCRSDWSVYKCTYIAQNVDGLDSSMLELSPGIPPPHSTANLYCPCQAHAMHQEIKSKLTWKGGFIAKTEGSARRMAPRPEN